jgi:ADP-ribose pyrophosphatase
MPFETLNKETVYRGKAFDVRRDQVRLPNGQVAFLDIVEHPGAVTLIPIDSQDRILFVRQYRHAAGLDLLELPAGTLEEGEEPEVCAHREVREETGMSAGKMRKIGGFLLAPGYSTEYLTIYLATDLYPDPLQGDDDEFISVENIPLKKVPELISQGVIQDAKSLAAWLLAQPFLERR